MLEQLRAADPRGSATFTLPDAEWAAIRDKALHELDGCLREYRSDPGAWSPSCDLLAERHAWQSIPAGGVITARAAPSRTGSNLAL